MTIDEFVKTYKVGKSYGYNGTYVGECVSLVKCYIRDVLGVTPKRIGDAKDYWSKREGKYIQSIFTPIANTPEFVPQRGDVFVRTSGTRGHIGIVLSATVKEFKTIEQNCGGCGYVSNVTHTSWENINFLRPKTLEKESDKMSYTKILLIGNSYTYYNGYGEILSRLCYAANKNNVIVVRATKGGRDAHQLKSETLEYKAWLNGKVIKSGKGTLAAINRIDFNSIGRAGKWDYIVLQNNTTLKKTQQYDVEMFNYVKGWIPKAANFIINVTHFGNKTDEGRMNQHFIAHRYCKCSLIDLRGIIEKYSTLFTGQSWVTELTIGDKPNYHASARMMYLNALCTFTKIFGTGTLSADGKTIGIPLYNADIKSAKKSLVNDCWHKGTTRGNSITKSVAAKLQYLVRKYAGTYIGTVLNGTASASAQTQTTAKETTAKTTTTKKYFPKYTGNKVSIVDALDELHYDSSYSYRKKIAAANGIKGFLGRPKQNDEMLAKLKDGQLIKP